MPVVSGKGNRTRKTLSFFGVNFDLSPPYDVLCDGPVIFQSLKNDLYLKQSLPKLLGGPAYPVVTECVVRELRRLGDDFTNAALFAKRAKRVPCVHDGKVDVAECLLSRLRDPSHTGSVLATNDPEVSKKATRVPGVAIISILNQKLILQAPSLTTVNYVKRSQKTKIHTLSESDRALVEEIKAAEDRQRQGKGVRKKRKRAKGPNPLSVKKSKPNSETNADGANGPNALLESCPPGKGTRSDKAGETKVDLEGDEGSRATTVLKEAGSPGVASGGSLRKRKRRRVSKPRAERSVGSEDAVNGTETPRLPQREDQSSASGRTGEQIKQVRKQQNVGIVAVADDASLTVSGVLSRQQGQEGLPPTANSAGTTAHECVKKLPSATQTREQTASMKPDAFVSKNVPSEAQLTHEKQSNKVSFSGRKSSTTGEASRSRPVPNQLSLGSSGGSESKEDAGAPKEASAGTDNRQLMHITEAKEDLADKSPHATPSGTRTKKQRKNRRRRPAKKTT